MVRRVPSKQKNARVAREYDRGAVKRLGLLLVCGLVLAGGFIYAGGRHFAALRIGYDTQKLRTELENAREEQRRLLLEREAAASPGRLERAARQLGMQAMMPGQIDPLKVAIETARNKVAPAQTQNAVKVQARSKPDKPTPEPKKRH